MRVYQKRLDNGHLFTARVCVPGDRQGPGEDHFSVTAEELNLRAKYRGDRFVAGGCLHADVLRHWPELRDVVALHLSDALGVPLHALANGWYWLAKSLGGFGERYHSSIFQAYLRLSDEETTHIVDATRQFMEVGEEGKPAAFENYERFVDGLRPRWAAEAAAAIAAYGGSREDHVD